MPRHCTSTRDLAFVYEQGAKFVDALYQRGGWDGGQSGAGKLAGQHRANFASREISGGRNAHHDDSGAVDLHPGCSLEYCSPVMRWVNGAPTCCCRRANDETARLSEETAQQAAAGWGGDHYEVYLNPQTDSDCIGRAVGVGHSRRCG